jgi:ABC-2 type transport system permease protein
MHWPSVVEAISTGVSDGEATQVTERDAEESGNALEVSEEVAADLAQEPDKLTAAIVLLRSSEAAWLLEEFDAQPNFRFFPQLGWQSGEEMQSYSLAVSRVGPLTSHYRDREAPGFEVEGADDEGGGVDEPSDVDDGDDEDEPLQRRGDVIEISPERTRLVVLGSASFVSDFVANLAQQQGGSDSHLANLQLIQNLVDWCLEDIDLLKIRSRGRYARLLAPTTPGIRQAAEWGNYAFALGAVVAIGGATLRRRRKAEPMVLPARSSAGIDGSSSEPASVKGRS